MSASRKEKRAAANAVEIPKKRKEKDDAKGKIQVKAADPPKQPSARPYQPPAPVAKPKVPVKPVTPLMGHNLLNKIIAQDRRDLVVMMRDSQRDPQDLAEDLLRDEPVIKACLGSHGTQQYRKERLVMAIKQASAFLERGVRPATKGVKKQKEREKTQAEVQKAADARINKATRTNKVRLPRVHVVPTVDEVAPKASDLQIMLSELRTYLQGNQKVRTHAMAAPTAERLANVLTSSIGRGFQKNVEPKLEYPYEYRTQLIAAGTILWEEKRQKDAAEKAASSPPLTIQQTPELLAARKAQQDALDNFVAVQDAKAKAPPPVPDENDPEAIEKRDRERRQQEILANHPKPVSDAAKK